MTMHISYYSQMYFLKNIIKDNFSLVKNLKAGSIIISTDDEIYYHINNTFEDKEIVINKEDYIMTSLITDLTKDSSYPTKLILFRNESFLRFEKYGGFIKELGLFDSFISYIKTFIKSKCVQEILSSNEYKYIRELVNNENYLNRILSDKHLKFLPFFGVNYIFGYTNKTMLISTINSIPGIVRLAQYKSKKTYKSLYYISILLSICEKFVTVIHEILLHLTSGYVNYLSEKTLSSESPKIDLTPDEEGFAFEEKLTGINKFTNLSFQSALALLDGITCQKNLKEFQIELNKSSNIKEISQKKSKGTFKGFIADFLKLYDIDFTVFKNENAFKNIGIKCRSRDEIFISMEERQRRNIYYEEE